MFSLATVYTALLELLLWLQPVPTGGGGGGGSGVAAAGDAAAGGGGYSCAMQAGLMAVMLVVFYFFLLRPEQKRRKEQEEMLKSIRKGTEVRTTGGLLGEVVSVKEDEVVLQIAKGTRVNVLRSAIATVVGGEGAPESSDSESKKGKDADAASDGA